MGRLTADPESPVTAPRFLIPDLQSLAPLAELPAQHTRHLRALRLVVDDRIALYDGHGRQRAAAIASISADRVTIRLLEEELENRESPFRLTLALACLKGDKLDWVIEKATELGVHAFVFFESENSLGGVSDNKLERWRRIAMAASQQSQRALLPAIHEPTTLLRLADDAPSESLRLILSEGEQEPPMLDVLPVTAAEAVILIGPEGGFTPTELQFCAEHGWHRVRFGPRILRAETAAIAAATALQFHFGDLARLR